ncbi:hypothetical protein M595_5465 [Lyngbya aestuarii BL J]|uniref:Uncharacterized protein n=1 Tax=Lyngbya aestuarii BL J TaxID=1348334 RepID=U7QC31_9CYAN|nr:hypothetical protein M595_5465 [Lyngbya aestuarii BL J]
MFRQGLNSEHSTISVMLIDQCYDFCAEQPVIDSICSVKHHLNLKVVY